jgi:hypothetical protein
MIVPDESSSTSLEMESTLRVQVFCLIDTRAAHDYKKEARILCL